MVQKKKKNTFNKSGLIGEDGLLTNQYKESKKSAIHIWPTSTPKLNPRIVVIGKRSTILLPACIAVAKPSPWIKPKQKTNRISTRNFVSIFNSCITPT
jgi:hypothetical protein